MLRFVDSGWKYGVHVGKLPTLSETARKSRPLSATQFFVSNPRSKALPVIDFDDLARTRKVLRGVSSFIHGSLLHNLAGSVTGRNEEYLLESTISELSLELDLGVAVGAGVVVHPGSGVDCHGKISNSIKRVLGTRTEATEGVGKLLGVGQGEVLERRRLLLENSAGEGTKACATLEEIREVIDGAGGDERIGVCIDTAHAFGSGLADLRKPGSFEAFLKRFDSVVGLGRLRLIHLNDSKAAFGSRLDRHENMGQGTIFGGRLSRALDVLVESRRRGIPVIGEPPDKQVEIAMVSALTAGTHFPLASCPSATPVAVVGGRHEEDEVFVRTAIGEALEAWGLDPSRIGIVTGGLEGTDGIAARMAIDANLPLTLFPADWDLQGRAAGPIRNTKIVGATNYVVALPGGRGTADAVGKARRKGSRVYSKIRPESPPRGEGGDGSCEEIRGEGVGSPSARIEKEG